jgi:hypothetical protein
MVPLWDSTRGFLPLFLVLTGAHAAMNPSLNIVPSNETVPPGGTAQIRFSLAKPASVSSWELVPDLDRMVFGPVAAIGTFSAARIVFFAAPPQRRSPVPVTASTPLHMLELLGYLVITIPEPRNVYAFAPFVPMAARVPATMRNDASGMQREIAPGEIISSGGSALVRRRPVPPSRTTPATYRRT